MVDWTSGPRWHVAGPTLGETARASWVEARRSGAPRGAQSEASHAGGRPGFRARVRADTTTQGGTPHYPCLCGRMRSVGMPVPNVCMRGVASIGCRIGSVHGPDSRWIGCSFRPLVDGRTRTVPWRSRHDVCPAFRLTGAAGMQSRRASPLRAAVRCTCPTICAPAARTAYDPACEQPSRRPAVYSPAAELTETGRLPSRSVGLMPCSVMTILALSRSAASVISSCFSC